LKIKKKISLIISAALLLTLILNSVFIYKYFYNHIQNLIIENYAADVKNKLDTLDRLLFERMSDINLIATDKVITAAKSNPLQIENRLSDFRNIFKFYVSLSFFDNERIRIADTARLNINIKDSFSRFWLMLDKKPIMTLDNSITLNIPVIYFAAPVTNEENGQPLGTVVSRMHIEKINEIMMSAEQLNFFDIELIDKNGTLIFSNRDKQGVFKIDPAKINIIDNISKSGKNSGCFQNTYTNSITIFSIEKGFMNFTGNNWILLYHIPKQFFSAPIKKIINYSVLFFICVFAITLFFIYVYIHFTI